MRHRVALLLRRLARWVDRGPIERLQADIDELLPDDLVVIFRGVDPENPFAYVAGDCAVIKIDGSAVERQEHE